MPSDPSALSDPRAMSRMPEWMLLGEIALQKCEPETAEEAVVLAALGNAFGRLGDAMSQKELLERALSIQQREIGESSSEAASTLTNLSYAYGRLGDVDKRHAALDQALCIKERIHIDLLERAADFQARCYGPDHPEVSATLMNLGLAFGRLGDVPRMRELLERVLEADERYYGAYHIEVANTLMNLAIAYGCLGQSKRKWEMLERALVIKESVLGDDHEDLAILRYNYAVSLRQLGEVGASEVQMSRAYAAFVASVGNLHPHAAMARARLKEWEADPNELEKANSSLSICTPGRPVGFGDADLSVSF